MNKHAVLIVSLVAALLAAFSPAPAQQRDLSFSAGIGLGDYHNSFAAGLATGGPLLSPTYLEVELFYYRMPAARSTVFGLAITSTAVDFNATLLLQATRPDRRFVPYAALTAGLIYESETWKYSLLKTKTSHSYSLWNVGLGAGAQILLWRRSGLRIDFRWLRVLGRSIQIPRISLGYFFRV